MTDETINWKQEAMRQNALLHDAISRAEKAEAKLAKAVEALRDFSKQKNTGELSDDEYHDADFEDAYNAFIDKSRAALAELEKTE